MGVANGSVDVRDARNIEFLRTINHTPSVEEQTEFMRWENFINMVNVMLRNYISL